MLHGQSVGGRRLCYDRDAFWRTSGPRGLPRDRQTVRDLGSTGVYDMRERACVQSVIGELVCERDGGNQEPDDLQMDDESQGSW